MTVNYNLNIIPFGMAGSKTKNSERKKQEKELANCLEQLQTSKTSTVPPLSLTKGINPNGRNAFDTFDKLDDVTRGINFVKSQKSWDDCLLEEMEEFTVARLEYQQNPTKQNYDHMEEEMGDIFFTAASIAKNSDINPEEAFKTTNRKFYNRINIMERLLKLDKNNPGRNLKDCRDYERRALWNAAKRKLYDAQTRQYENQSTDVSTVRIN